MGEIDKKRLLSYRESHYLTWGQLKEFAKKHNISDNALVVVERVEDIYFKKHNWDVYAKETQQSLNAQNHNNHVNKGKWAGRLFTEQEILDFKTKYHPAWSPVFYPEDPEVLFLDIHY